MAGYLLDRPCMLATELSINYGSPLKAETACICNFKNKLASSTKL